MGGDIWIDHMTPVSRGGSDKDDNLTASCKWCNQRKGDLTFSEFTAAEAEDMGNP